jgi:hypothetical protein
MSTPPAAIRDEVGQRKGALTSALPLLNGRASEQRQKSIPVPKAVPVDLRAYFAGLGGGIPTESVNGESGPR